MKAIFERRSIRKYQDKEIPDTVIRDLLRAGMCAPSAANERPWHFIVIRDRNILNSIADVHPYAQMVKEAPLVIAVSADHLLAIAERYLHQDCAAATENILIEAQDQGLGGVWLGVYPDDERKRALGNLLNIPENVEIFSLISLGYPAEVKEAVDRYDETRVHWEGRW